MTALEHFFNENDDKRIFVYYKNSSVGDLTDLHYMCLLKGKILTILTPRVNKYSDDLSLILKNDSSSRVYEVTTMAMRTVLRKRCMEYVEQVGASILIPDSLME